MTSERERQIRSLLTRHEARLDGVDTARPQYHSEHLLVKALREVLEEYDRLRDNIGTVRA